MTREELEADARIFLKVADDADAIIQLRSEALLKSIACSLIAANMRGAAR